MRESGSFLELSQKPDDTAAYLLASPANAERLRLAYQQFDRRKRIDFTPPAD